MYFFNTTTGGQIEKVTIPFTNMYSDKIPILDTNRYN